ncbi:MAG: YqaA family protein [Kiloniellaceae bacterium]
MAAFSLQQPSVVDLGIYTGLFLIAFLAATIFPAQSEVGLAGLILSGDYSIALLVAVASAGNTLGALVNWVIGRGVERFSDRRWFPVTPARLERATRWYRRYGRWSLLLSWAPIVGDPLTVVAGVLREPLASFFLLVALAKTCRYIVVAAVALI